MDEYIERETVLRNWPMCDEPADVYQFVRDFPAADVIPVIHSHWNYKCPINGSSYKYCSNCLSVIYDCFEIAIMPDNYCPNCGADMREKKK